MSRFRLLATCLALSTAIGCASARAMSRGYTINTPDLTCDEANRYTQEALTSMDLRITDFRKARIGSPGYAAAEREDGRGGLSGSVDITCDQSGVRIVPDESGFSTTREFERGVFLSVIGRGDLVVEREGRYSTGTLHKRQHAQVEVDEKATDGAPPSAIPAPAGGVEVQVELVRGFATVLDFEANVAAAGILPVKITISNGTARAYDFEPSAVVLRVDDGDAVEPLGASKAVERLRAKAGAEGDAAGELGDLEAASRVIPEREIKGKRLAAGEKIDGYLYFPDAEYTRARVTMTDVATGEGEGFLVEF
jgi:hypothetical protein